MLIVRTNQLGDGKWSAVPASTPRQDLGIALIAVGPSEVDAVANLASLLVLAGVTKWRTRKPRSSGHPVEEMNQP